jgi:DNA-binding NtrC family response regulator
MTRLQAHAWPGNVRELVHVVQRAAAMSGGDVIDVNDLPEHLHPGAATPPSGPVDALLDRPLREALAALERRMIEHALAKSGGNRAEAARTLGIARPQLYAKMEEHGITGRSRD